MDAKKLSGAKKVKARAKAASRKVYTLRLNKVERGMLNDVAKHRGISISELIRQLIAEGVHAAAAERSLQGHLDR